MELPADIFVFFIFANTYLSAKNAKFPAILYAHLLSLCTKFNRKAQQGARWEGDWVGK